MRSRLLAGVFPGILPKFPAPRLPPTLFKFSSMSTSPSPHSAKRLKNDISVEINMGSAAKRSTPLKGNISHAVCAQGAGDDRKLKKTPRHLPIRQVTPNNSSNTCFLQIYGTGLDTGETIPTVLLFFDQRRFIFNAGEGIQRYCTEHRIKLSKIDHVFLTRISSETAGGLPGLLLTLAGINEAGMAVQIWGPGEFQNLVNAIRSFVPNAATVHTHCFGAGGDQKEGDEKFNASACTLTPIVLLEDVLVKISAVILRPDAGVDMDTMKEGSRNVSVIYICELPEVLGKFDPKKALAKGLKQGYKYGKLQKGESVMSDDGTQVVHPNDVLGPSSPGPIMLLVDCPDVTYIRSLISASSIQPYYSGLGKVVNCVVHLGPSFVTNHEHYQNWMENFKDAHHLMAGWQGRNSGSPILKSSARILSKLNLICPDVFPISGFLSSNHQDSTIEQLVYKTNRAVPAQNLLKFRFRPIAALGLDSSSVPESFDMLAAQEEFARDCLNVTQARDLVSGFWKRNGEAVLSPGTQESQQMVPDCVLNSSREEMEIVFLGTGSSQPSKYRNVSGIYVHLFDNGGILLDCGEGTYAQLKRRYGSEGADNILWNMKCIWISHIHADHHAGLPRLLSARKKLVSQSAAYIPILVIGPRPLKVFLDAYGMVEDLGLVFLDCSQTTGSAEMAADSLASKEMVGGGKDGIMEERGIDKDESHKLLQPQGFHLQQGVDVPGRETLKHVLQSMGLQRLVSVPVVHCPNAFGIVLNSIPKSSEQGKTMPGWKLVYSGDTRPCQALIEASNGATVLIHEATFDDSMLTEAIPKKHSITKEAIEVGMLAGVYRIILTHFSQRYPKIPVFDEKYTTKACIAFDMMNVNLADLSLLPRLVPAFKMLFQDDILMEDEDESTD